MLCPHNKGLSPLISSFCQIKSNTFIRYISPIVPPSQPPYTNKYSSVLIIEWPSLPNGTSPCVLG